MSEQLAIALLVLLMAAIVAVAVGQRVWEPTHVTLVRELDRRLRREESGRGRTQPAARRLSATAWVGELRDVERSLVIAGRSADVPRWVAVQLVRVGAVAALLVALNVLWLWQEGGLLLDWGWAAVVAVVVPPLAGYEELRFAVHRAREELGRAFRDMLDLLAVMAAGATVADPMRDPGEIRPGDWIARYARWRRDPTLRSVVEGNRWQLVTQRRPRTAAEWFELIGDEYSVPEARVVARVLRLQRERGPEVAEEYLREARRLSKQQLADRQVRSQRDRVAHTVASVGLLASFFSLLILAASSVRL